MTRLSAASRPNPEETMIAISSTTLLTGRDNTIYVYNDILWSKKSSNTKILQKSIDWGENWTDVYTFDNNVGIIIVTLDGTILVGQKTSDNLYIDPPAEIYRSTDDGKTFSSVLTLSNGGFGTWSFDVYQNTIFVGEYGKYNALHVYKSIDSGKTWSTSFTHPIDGSVTVHIHKIHIDNVTPTTIYVSVGDGTAAKGVWYSLDNGVIWSELLRNHQPTWIETDTTYIYLAEDLEGVIHRIPKNNLTNIETVYDASTDSRTSLGNLSFYSGRTDPSNGLLLFGGVSYGLNDTHNNNRNAILIASIDQGANWVAVNIYNAYPTAETGPAFISTKGSNDLFYIKTSAPSTIQKLNSTNLYNQISIYPTRTTLTRKNLTPNLVYNNDFEIVPSTLTANTNVVSKWIDGTASGNSATSSNYGWAIPTGGLAGTSSACFDSVEKYSGSYSMKLVNPSITSAISVSTYRTTAIREYFYLQPSTTYILSCYMKTTNSPTNGAYIDLREYNSSGSTITTTSSTKYFGTNDWFLVTKTITTNASTKFGSILLRANVTGNISTVWFDNISLVLATNITRSNV